MVANVEEAAALVRNHAKELARLAQRHGLSMLCYLLEMAVLEADQHIRKKGAADPPP